MPGDERLLMGDAGFAEQRFPLGAPEGPSDGDLAILAHESVPEGEAGEEGEPVIGEGVTVEVADEPAAGGVLLQPSQERDDLLVRQVVGELRRDDEVEFLRRPVGEGVIVDEVDSGGWVGGFFRGTPAPRG